MIIYDIKDIRTICFCKGWPVSINIVTCERAALVKDNSKNYITTILIININIEDAKNDYYIKLSPDDVGDDCKERFKAVLPNNTPLDNCSLWITEKNNKNGKTLGQPYYGNLTEEEVFEFTLQNT